MTHNNIDVNIKLKGQYKFSVIDNNATIYTSPWCSNTILSGGLVDLYTYDIPSILNYLDLGVSNSLPGSLGYGLQGVLTASEFVNIYRDIIDSYQDTISSKTYVVSFTTEKATISSNIQEFAIKRDSTHSFARNVFLSAYPLYIGQLINFQYQLVVTWGATTTSNLPITGNKTNYTYTIPVTSTTYNIPYDGLYYSNNKLLLLGNVYNKTGAVDNSLPRMGDSYPLFFDWGIGSSAYSTYSPIVLSSNINNLLRQYTVSIAYSGIACQPYSEVYSNINTALLVKDGNTTIPSNMFNVTRFAFPLTVYSSIVPCPSSGPSNLVSNTLTLGYNYIWGEC